MKLSEVGNVGHKRTSSGSVGSWSPDGNDGWIDWTTVHHPHPRLNSHKGVVEYSLFNNSTSKEFLKILCSSLRKTKHYIEIEAQYVLPLFPESMILLTISCPHCIISTKVVCLSRWHAWMGWIARSKDLQTVIASLAKQSTASSSQWGWVREKDKGIKAGIKRRAATTREDEQTRIRADPLLYCWLLFCSVVEWMSYRHISIQLKQINWHNAPSAVNPPLFAFFCNYPVSVRAA